MKPILLQKDHETRLKDLRINELEAALAGATAEQRDAAQAWTAVRE